MSESVEREKRLWEVTHKYYCALGNYYATGNEQPMEEFACWEDFMRENGTCDMDLNLVFRWDWFDPQLHEKEFNEGSQGELRVFWMGQRKGLYRFSLVQVTRDDEPAVREWLIPRMNHLMSLWAPLVPTPAEDGQL